MAALDGLTACRMIEEEKPDLILLDLMLPGLNGWEISRIVRSHKHEEISETPIIMLTALSSPEDRLKGLELGANNYISKPFEIKEVLLKVARLVRKKRNEQQLSIKIQEIKTIQKQHEELQDMLCHELRNQLFVIGGLSSRMAESRGPAPDKYRSYARAIKKSSSFLYSLAEEILLISELAKEKEVLIISSPCRTFATARLINLCMPISHLMSKIVPTVGLITTVNEVREKILESKYRCLMIVDDDNHLIGIITRSDLLEPIQKQVILVDHNEISQAVDGIESADILEIIDHHRVGDISTIGPITVYNEPIGSTCTIVAGQIFLHRIEMIPDIAGVLLSGILSDTLLLTLSTTTGKDREMANKLAEIADLDLTTFGKELLASSINLKGKTPRDILFQDFKTYHFNEKKIGVN